MNYNKRCDTHAGLISEKIREKEKLLILKSAMHAHTHTRTRTKVKLGQLLDQ